jgi:hypothetical protein
LGAGETTARFWERLVLRGGLTCGDLELNPHRSSQRPPFVVEVRPDSNHDDQRKPG